MDQGWAGGFVSDWLAAWNDHDVEGVLGHFAEDVVFTSPVAARVLAGSDGVVTGKEALRAYWVFALTKIPDLRFEVVGFYVGVSTLVIHYRNQAGGLVCEVLSFRDGLVTEGHGTYLAADSNPAGVNA